LTDSAADYSECSKEDITAMSVMSEKNNKNIKNSNKRSKVKIHAKMQWAGKVTTVSSLLINLALRNIYTKLS